MNRIKRKLTLYDKYLIEQISHGRLRQFLCNNISNPRKRLRYTLAKETLIDNEILFEHKHEFGYELSINLSHELIKNLHL